jgi:hypothetical protein
MDNKQSPPIGKISADTYDPYDAYTAENGKEQALTIELAKNTQNKKTIEGFSGEGGLTMYNTMTTEIPYKAQTKDYKYYCDAFNICPDPAIEGFADSSQSDPYTQWQQQLQQSLSTIPQPQLQQLSQQLQNNSTQNNTMQNKPWQRPQSQYNLSPALQAQTQIQPKQLIENFTSPSVISSPSSSSLQQQQNMLQSIPQGYDQSAPSPAPITLPYYGSNPLGKCGPLQAPPYILPVNDSNLAQFQQAINVAVEQTGSQSSDANAPYPLRRVDMSKVGGYYDEELEKFLTTQSMQSEQLPPPLKETPVDVNKYDSIYPLRPLYEKTATETNVVTPNKPPASVNNLFTPSMMPTYNITPSSTPTNYLQSSQYILDILLFIGGGIIIILLCDQIFRLGMSYGMRDTVQVLMPYLQDIHQNIKIGGD